MRKIIFALAIVGIVVSTLSLQAHYAANSGMVLHSSFSTIWLVPVAAIGVAGYLLLALLAWFYRRGWTLLFAWIGLGFAAYLTYIEAYVLRAWSAYCIVSQCLIALIAILAVIDVGIAIARRLNKATDVVDQVVNNVRYG